MNGLQAILFWLATLFLAGAFLLGLFAAFFGRRGAFRIALGFTVASAVTLTVFGIRRWIDTGHPPFVTLFESVTVSVWFVLLLFIIFYWRWRHVAPTLIPLSFINFLLMGWASTMETAAGPLSAALDNTWLFIHASFATSGAATFLLASSLSFLYLIGAQRLQDMKRVAARVPDHAALPRTIHKLLLFGLILWGVMIVSGSIWAQAAWGRYWAWDPIELWSLISWLLFALLIHARFTFKFSQQLFCWLVIGASLTVVFALWGVGYVYETIHSYG